MSQRRCRYAPLVTGQTLPVPLDAAAAELRAVLGCTADGSSGGVALMRVVGTLPRHTAVIVGPQTEVVVVGA